MRRAIGRFLLWFIWPAFIEEMQAAVDRHNASEPPVKGPVEDLARQAGCP